MDYYNTLGVARNASPEDLKKAYKKASMQHHPDRGGDESKFKEVNEAYSTLKDPNKRQQYDNPQPQFNTNNMRGGMPPGFDNIFEQFGFRQQQQQNPDITIVCDISLEECIRGKQVIATYQLRNGKEETVDIQIPPGANDGNMIRYQGLGEQLMHGPRGNLIVKIQVRKHPIFEKDRLNLIVKHQVSVFDLLLGCQQDIPTLEGGSIRLTIPQGTKPGITFNVSGHGLPDVQSGRKGNMYVIIDAYCPKIEDPVHLIKIKELKDSLAK